MLPGAASWYERRSADACGVEIPKRSSRSLRLNPFGQKIEAVEGIERCAAIGMIQQCIADNYTCKYSRSLR